MATGVAFLILRPARPGIRAFATFAILLGVGQVLANLGMLLGSATMNALAWPLFAMSAVALVGAVGRYAGRSLGLATTLLLIACGAGAIVAWVDPARMVLPTGGLNDLGIVLWYAPLYLGPAIASWALVRFHGRTPSKALRTETLLLLLALLPHLAYTSAVSFGFVLQNPDIVQTPSGARMALWSWAYYVTFGATLLVSAAIVVVLLRKERHARLLGLLVAAVVIVGAAQVTISPEVILFGGALRILAAVMLAYGLLKYGLFDVDLKLKWSLDRGALLAIFGGVFFLVDQAAQFFVSAAFGALAGIIAAVGLLFLLKPLRKATQRLADRIFPHVHATPEYLSARKLTVYRAAAEAAAKDGVITDREREMLAALIRELAIAPEEVASVEREVLARASAA